MMDLTLLQIAVSRRTMSVYFFIRRKTLQYIRATPIRPRYVKLHALLAAVAIGQPFRYRPGVFDATIWLIRPT